MRGRKKLNFLLCAAWIGCFVFLTSPAYAQLTDLTQTPNTINEGIHKSLAQEMGAVPFGLSGDVNTPDSSIYTIKHDPFRAIRRGRQLFMRKFTRAQGQGPRFQDGIGNFNTTPALGAGLGDSCASCHGRPRGSAGFGGDVVTRPDSRDAPHLFGLGLREMLADEITTDLRAIRAKALSEAKAKNKAVTKKLVSKGISYGSITAYPTSNLDISNVQGVNPDLRVRPFFAQGGTISIREFLVGAAKVEMGVQAVDPTLYNASVLKDKVTTPAGMVLDGSIDLVEAPPTADPNADPDNDGVKNEMPQSLVDFIEFYLLNYFEPATYKKTPETEAGRQVFAAIGCTKCHIPNLTIERDRRVASVETVYDPLRGIFNKLFATASPLFVTYDDHSGFPLQKLPALNPFLVDNIFTDFKRHDLGPNFWERNFDGSIQKEFLTRPLWGVGTTAPYGHDGRSINLAEVILRHGGEAQGSRDTFAKMDPFYQDLLVDFLNSLVLFPPDDTASNLDPGNPNTPGFPQVGHGSIKLTVLFNDPTDLE
jgi:hypothetical protein